MRDPNGSSRDIRPRVGSPLWTYLSCVTAVGLGVLALAFLRLAAVGLADLLSQPLLWAIGLLALIGELRPIVTPGKSDQDSGAASVTFCFAALLYWGFAVAVPMLALTAMAAALIRRHALFRAAFNMAQYSLALGCAAAVLAGMGIQAQPLRPWVPDGTELLAVALAAAGYFVVNFSLVSVAVALHSREPIPATFRSALPYQAFVNLVLLSAAPLVVVVMGRSAVLVLLFLLPLAAIYASAAMSLQREYQALHDALTGLPNRTLLFRQTTQAISAAFPLPRRVGFLLLDLDRFKEVNDTLGHPVGDTLLRVIGHRLAHSVRPGDVVARLGGDEFAVLLPSVRDAAAAREVAVRLRAAIAEPIRLEGMSFEVEASIGVALHPEDASTVELLLQRADVAMYLAKERRTGVEMYASDADRNSPARLSLLGDLRRGIDRGELELYYQPKVLLAGGRPAGVEALLRWRHPVRGLLRPADFLPAAEQSYLMRDLTTFVVHTAFAQAAQWQRAGLGVPVSFHVSGRDLRDAGLSELIQSSLAEQDLLPADVMLEISERVLAGEPAQATATVAELAALGVAISFDDFGTAYSSLVRLKRLAVSEVKISPALIGRLLDSPEDELIVRSVLDLVRALGIRSVAEGVESAQVADALRALGCDTAQGKILCEPMDALSVTSWLTERLRVPGGPVPRHRPTGEKRAQPAQGQPAQGHVVPAGDAAGLRAAARVAASGDGAGVRAAGRGPGAGDAAPVRAPDRIPPALHVTGA
jgi:diguanylate cyclase (GGDEF)-like protein